MSDSVNVVKLTESVLSSIVSAEDGNVIIPEPLRKYLNNQSKLA